MGEKPKTRTKKRESSKLRAFQETYKLRLNSKLNRSIGYNHLCLLIATSIFVVRLILDVKMNKYYKQVFNLLPFERAFSADGFCKAA